MGDRTGIEWTQATWNPVRGCSRISPGCEHCYAETVAARFSGPGQPYEGLARRAPNGEARWTGTVRLVPEMLDQPLRWKRPRRIFINSMSDLFHESLPDDVIDKVFAVMMLTARWSRDEEHTFQVLTKRADRMRAYVSDERAAERVIACAERFGYLATTVNTEEERAGIKLALAKGSVWPLPNVWLGVSVENQETADERIPLLLQTPAAVRFISAEPLLGPVDLTHVGEHDGRPLSSLKDHPCVDDEPGGVGLDWVIVGGESGPKARPMALEWAGAIVDQCRAAEVPCFMKQLGAVPMMDEAMWRAAERQPLLRYRNDKRVPEGFVPLAFNDRKGSDIDEWPTDLRVRDFPVEVGA